MASLFTCAAAEEALPDLTRQFAGDGTGITLPAQIVRRARSTIAHEIAHTFFYDTASMPPRPTVQIDDPASATTASTCVQPNRGVNPDCQKQSYWNSGSLHQTLFAPRNFVNSYSMQPLYRRKQSFIVLSIFGTRPSRNHRCVRYPRARRVGYWCDLPALLTATHVHRCQSRRADQRPC